MRESVENSGVDPSPLFFYAVATVDVSVRTITHPSIPLCPNRAPAVATTARFLALHLLLGEATDTKLSSTLNKILIYKLSTRLDKTIFLSSNC